MKNIKTNNANHFGKRTASQVSSILKNNGIICRVENLGDGRAFDVMVESSIKTRYSIKKAGFILMTGTDMDKFITIKAF